MVLAIVYDEHSLLAVSEELDGGNELMGYRFKDYTKSTADIVIYSPNNEPALVVEVKHMNRVTDQWASQLRRNLLAHSAFQNSRFFLLALPDFFYLWRNDGSIQQAPADYKVRAKDVLRHYAEADDLEGLSGFGLELLVSSWLDALLSSQIRKEDAPELIWIFDSGLYDSIRGGSMEIRALA